MQINNNTNVVKKNIEQAENKKFQKPKETYTKSEKGLLLPDIRGNQVLLPDNKIYTPKGVQPQTFNKKGLTIELPKNYRVVPEMFQEEDLMNATKYYFKGYNVTQYDNLQNNDGVIRATKNDYSKDGVLKSAEVMEINVYDIDTATRYIEDYEHNTVTEIKVRDPLFARRAITDSITTLYKDDNGKVTKRVDYTSSPVKGIYDISETDANGKTTVLSKTTKNKDGSYTTVKNLKSLDGTTTNYRYRTDKDGKHKSMFCQIKDKDGKVLSTVDRTYDRDKENPNITYSSINGNKFKAEKMDGNLEITNQTTGKKTLIRPEEILASDETKAFLKSAKQDRGFTDENVFEKLFDTLPADTLLTIKNNVAELVPIKNDLDSAFIGLYDLLMCKTDSFVLSHELGHSKDIGRVPDGTKLTKANIKEYSKSLIADKDDFYMAFLEERERFTKAFPDFEQKFVKYFIESTEKKPDRGRKEIVAETNAINGIKPEAPEKLAIRTTLLQQYFPRTIAEATKRLNMLAMPQQNM